MTKTIGTITTYDGNEHLYLRGHKVRIVAMLPRAAAPDFDPDRDGAVLRDDDEVERAGGISADDRVEVEPWLEREQG
jgi:hypothetical protein